MSNVRKDSRPYGENATWQTLTFELERRDRSGRPVARVAVELGGLKLTGPIPADGAAVRAVGRYGRDGVFRAERVINMNTGHTVTASSYKVFRWIAGTIAVCFVVVIAIVIIVHVTGGATTHTKTVVVPALAGMSQSEAAATLERAGFSLFDYQIVQKSSSVRFGSVIGTEPAAGTSVTLDGHTPTVVVDISIG